MLIQDRASRRTRFCFNGIAHGLPILRLEPLHICDRIRRREARTPEAWHRRQLVADNDFDARVRRLGDRVDVVASLEREEELAARESREHVGHVRVAVRRDEHLAEFVALSRVVTGRD